MSCAERASADIADSEAPPALPDTASSPLGSNMDGNADAADMETDVADDGNQGSAGTNCSFADASQFAVSQVQVPPVAELEDTPANMAIDGTEGLPEDEYEHAQSPAGHQPSPAKETLVPCSSSQTPKEMADKSGNARGVAETTDEPGRAKPLAPTPTVTRFARSLTTPGSEIRASEHMQAFGSASRAKLARGSTTTPASALAPMFPKVCAHSRVPALCTLSRCSSPVLFHASISAEPCTVAPAVSLELALCTPVPW
jgi:hypothetical protein